MRYRVIEIKSLSFENKCMQHTQLSKFLKNHKTRHEKLSKLTRLLTNFLQRPWNGNNTEVQKQVYFIFHSLRGKKIKSYYSFAQ